MPIRVSRVTRADRIFDGRDSTNLENVFAFNLRRRRLHPAQRDDQPTCESP